MIFFFLEINFAAMLFYAYPCVLVIMFIKVGRKNLWTLEIGHGTKMVEKHWTTATTAFDTADAWFVISYLNVINRLHGDSLSHVYQP